MNIDITVSYLQKMWIKQGTKWKKTPSKYMSMKKPYIENIKKTVYNLLIKR